MVYEFGITSLGNKKDFLQRGDLVQFQIERTRDNKERATQIKVARKKLRSTVDAIKGQFGFLNYEVEDGNLQHFQSHRIQYLIECFSIVFLQARNCSFICRKSKKTLLCNLVMLWNSSWSQTSVPANQPPATLSKCKLTLLSDNIISRAKKNFTLFWQKVHFLSKLCVFKI